MEEESGINIPGYRIESVLGAGGMAKVYLAIQDGFDRQVALKVISPVLAADEEFGRRFLREARIVGNLSHSHIVPVYDVGEINGLYYLSMETLPGGDLKERLGKGISEERALLITEQMASALSYAHNKGFIHRDVKPDNVLFRDEDTAVLTDFGIARTEDDSGEMTQITQVKSVIGSPKYMSPEQAMGNKLDARTDIYSLGIMLYEMLTGSVPYSGKNVTEISLQRVERKSPSLPAEFGRLQTLVNKMLAYDVADRYQNCQDIINDIKNLRQARDTMVGAARSEIDATVVYQPENSKPQTAKSSRTSIYVGAVMLALAIAGVLYYVALPSASDTDLASKNPPTESSATEQAVSKESTDGNIDAEASRPISRDFELTKTKEYYAYLSAVTSDSTEPAKQFLQNYPDSYLNEIVQLKLYSNADSLNRLLDEANAGNLRSQFVLSQLYSDGWGGVAVDVKQAEVYAKLAAGSGNSLALFALASLLLEDPNKEANMREGVQALKESANKGFFLSQTLLANLHFAGELLPRDIDKSIELYKLAGQQGDRDALFNLGIIYDSGTGLEKPKEKEAQELFKRAAVLGHPDAINYIN
ncbi:MAG: serine/threonine-protein kinase [Pseudomonadales bacterium]